MSPRGSSYEIKRRPTGLFFLCLYCSYEVKVTQLPGTRKFGARTVAASAMKEHALLLHGERVQPEEKLL